MLSLTSAKVTGTPGPSGWVQIHDFYPDEEEKRKTRGHLFAVIATKRFEEGVSGVAAGRELIARLQEEYFGELTIKPFNALKASVEKVISEFGEALGDVEIAACSIVDNVVYSATGGGGEVMIYRGGMLAPILVSQSMEVVTASGFPRANDDLILGTKNFFDSVSGGVIKGALENKEPEDAAEAFAPLVHSAQPSGNMGVVVIKFRENALSEPRTFEATSSPKAEKIGFLNRFSSLKPGIFGFLEKVSKKIPEQRIYIKQGGVDDAFSKSKKLSFTVAIILLGLLVVSIGFGIRQNRINKIKTSYVGKLNEANNDLDQAISVSGVDIGHARELFRTSEDLYNQILDLKVTDPKISELGEKIETQKGAILGEYEETPELFWDLSLLSSGFKGDKISASGGQVYVLDGSGRRVAGVEISTKKSSIVASPDEMVNPKGITSYTNSVFILDSDGVYEVDNSRQKVVDKTWTGDAFIAAYTGNLYLLDKDSSAIYRFSGSGGTFSAKQNWLSSDTKPDFSGALSWAIDGSVYVLYPNAKILKFSLGSPQNFSITGVDLTNIDAIFASDDTSGVYVLDRVGKRVVVLDKNGVYKAEYINDKIGDATALAVSETEKKIILLSGDKLLSLDIKHL